jgi:hypothetical protein
MAKIIQHQHLENKKLEKLFSDEKNSPSIVSKKRTLLGTLGTNLSHQRLLGLITQSIKEEGSTVLGYMLT